MSLVVLAFAVGVGLSLAVGVWAAWRRVATHLHVEFRAARDAHRVAEEDTPVTTRLHEELREAVEARRAAEEDAQRLQQRVREAA